MKILISRRTKFIPRTKQNQGYIFEEIKLMEKYVLVLRLISLRDSLDIFLKKV
jgi:hypothetical protein